ncbi:MAG: YfhO family protein [Bacteroidetes bacterium]|nr:YfhO family protein [Bacteroidota bacterium]
MKTAQNSWAWWDSQSAMVKNLISLAILFILPIFLSPDTILGDKEFMANDIVQWRGGAESIIQAREKYGYEPLWAANMYGGMPAYFISYQISVINIDTLVAYSFWRIFPAATFWVGLIGLFFLFRFLRLSHFASLFGAITIAFTTYIPIIIGAGHNSKFYAFNFIPWLFLGFFMILNGRKKWLLSIALFSLALSLELRAGHPQVTYYFGIVLAIVWLNDTFTLLKEKAYNAFLKKSGMFLAAVFIAVLSVVQPYWSKSEFTPFSTRGGSVLTDSKGLDIDYAFAWSQGWGELMTLIIPNSYGGASGDGAYWGPKAFTSGPHYFGALAVLFFVFGLVFYKGKWKIPFLVSGILTMLFSLGNNFLLLNELMYHYLPYFSKFRTPEMWLIATVFSFAIISVFGFQEVLNRGLDDKKWLYVTGGVLGFGLILSLASTSVLSFQKDGEKQQIAQQIASSNRVSVNDPRVQQSVNQVIKNQLLPAREKAASKDSWRFVILIVIGGAVLYLVSIKKLNTGMAGLSLVLVAAFDMISVGTRYIPHYSKIPTGFDQEAKVKQQLNSLDLYIKNNMLDSTGVWPYRSFPITANPFNNAAPSFYYPSIGGYTAVKIGAFQDLIDEALYNKEGMPNDRILAMLNVKYLPINQNASLPGYKVAHSDEAGVVLELEQTLPKAWFVFDVHKAESGKEALDYIKKDNFDPWSSSIAEGIDEEMDFDVEDNSVATVSKYEPRLIEIQTSNVHDGFMVLSEMYYPKGWTATLDGKEIPIYRTNFVLRGMKIPSGTHTVKLEFNPASYKIGTIISWIGTAMIWLLLIGAFVIERKPEEIEHS